MKLGRELADLLTGSNLALFLYQRETLTILHAPQGFAMPEGLNLKAKELLKSLGKKQKTEGWQFLDFALENSQARGTLLYTLVQSTDSVLLILWKVKAQIQVDWGALKKKYALTRRQCTTMNYALEGLSNQEIGRKMDISHNTVKSHLREVYDKTKISGREELWSLAFRFWELRMG